MRCESSPKSKRLTSTSSDIENWSKRCSKISNSKKSSLLRSKNKYRSWPKSNVKRNKIEREPESKCRKCKPPLSSWNKMTKCKGRKSNNCNKGSSKEKAKWLKSSTL